jgi:predicted ABC-type ATPase
MAELYGTRQGRDMLFRPHGYARDAYDPAEARAPSGEWTAGGGGAAGVTAKPFVQPRPKGGGAHKITTLTNSPKLTSAEARARGDAITKSVGASEAVAKAERMLKGGRTTVSIFKKGEGENAVYTSGRYGLHQKLVDDLLTPARIAAATPKGGQKPVMTLLGGRGGSGKSWLTSENGPIDKQHAIVIDSDEFKRQLPEYDGWNAALLHDEVDDIVKMAVQQAQALGLNVVHDQTMKTYQSALDRVEDYEKHGYDIHGHYMHLPAEMAAARAALRFMGGDTAGDEPGARKTTTGRYVPAWVILGNTDNEKNFNELIPHFNKWSVYDSTHTKRGENPDRVEGSD